MKKHFLTVVAFVFYFSFTTAQTQPSASRISYPATKTVDTITDYFGNKVPDPYRWLEEEATETNEVRNWINNQNEITFQYLSQIPYREQIKNRLTELANYPKQSSPVRWGDYYFYAKNDGLQNQYVTYYRKGADGNEMVFIDPNKLSEDGTITQNLAGFSNDRKYVAVTQAKSGSDWNELYIREVTSNTLLKDRIEWVKFSGAAWYKDGFFYSGYDKPDANTYTGTTQYQKVFYHKLGTPQSEDKLIYSDAKNPRYYFGAQTTEDERYLFINVSPGTYGTEIWWKDMRRQDDVFKLLFKGFEYEYGILDNEGDKLIVQTNFGAPNFKVVMVDPQNPSPENWKTIIPEQKETLESVNVAGGKLFAFYLKDVKPLVKQYARNGMLEREVQLPGGGIGTVSGFSGEKDDPFVYYSFTSFISPVDIYKYDIATGKSELFKKSEVKFDASKYEMKQVFYTSKDGTQVPMFLVHKKGIAMDGNNPCLLYAYGGFNIAQKPSFNTSRLALVEQGFVFALANIRGGNEYGEEWHKAAMLENKQTVFDDFIAAAEYLIKEKYTSSDKLAIQGRSNGGLLVGAVMTQRPDLFQVALPGVGVLDMLRYHKFTVGGGWAVEYGSSDKKEDFEYLIKYSPLHNIKRNTSYPATLITTADHDDRVVPAHSFKFAAALQQAQVGNNPVLIRIDTKAGHGGGKPLTKIIEEDADWISFTMCNLGLRSLVVN